MDQYQEPADTEGKDLGDELVAWKYCPFGLKLLFRLLCGAIMSPSKDLLSKSLLDGGAELLDSARTQAVSFLGETHIPHTPAVRAAGLSHHLDLISCLSFVLGLVFPSLFTGPS